MSKESEGFCHLCWDWYGPIYTLQSLTNGKPKKIRICDRCLAHMNSTKEHRVLGARRARGLFPKEHVEPIFQNLPRRIIR